MSKWRASGQDGGIGRHTVPPCTTKRTTANLKTKNNRTALNQTVWKSDNQGVKEETFIQTFIKRGGDGQLGRGTGSKVAGVGPRQGGGWWSGWSQIHMQINQG